MTDTQLRILILEDNSSDAELVQRELRKAGLDFAAQVSQDKATYLQALDGFAPDLILADYSLPGFDGLGALALARQRFPEVPVVIVSGAIGEETAIEALKAGATDYVLKQRLSRLGPVVKRALQEAQQLAEKRQAEQALRQRQEALRKANEELLAAEERLTQQNEELQAAEEELRQQNDELHVSQAALGREKARYLDLFETAPDGYIVTDPQGTIQQVNRVAARLFGYPASYFEGKLLHAFLPAASLPEYWRRYDELERGATAVLQWQTEISPHNGQPFWAALTTAAVHDAQGSLIGLRWLIRDITERKQTEERVAKSEALLRAVTDNTTDAVYVKDLQSRWLMANPALLGMVGKPAEEVLGRHDGEIYADPAIGLAILANDRRILERGEPEVFEETAQTPQGLRVFLSTKAPWRDARGQVVGVIGVSRDITERKHMEESLLEAKAAAEAANKAKGRFLANVSHELRTPMNAILGMVDLALEKQVDATSRDFLQTAKESADLLLALLDDLLDSAKIESGKLALESAPFSLRRVLDQLTRVLAVRASEKGVCFSCRIPTEVPDAFVGDQVRLRQVLFNLAGNGIKFTESGEVTISVCVLEGLAIRDRELEEGKQPAESDSSVLILNPQSPIPSVTLEFTVRDTGIGIPRGDWDRIFHPFAQADASTTRRFGGTGLGLTICSTLVSMMGGRIWVESELGHGSVFRFTTQLPLAKDRPPEPRPSVEVLPPAAYALRVLLVEDNPANQKLAAYVLQKRGHVVDVAGDGQQGLNMTRANHYDAILMDVQMPGMDGLEATAAIRKRESEEGLEIRDWGLEKEKQAATADSLHRIPTPQSPIPSRHVPIIAMTAHATKDDRERCLAHGMDGYLSKPVNFHEMIVLLESLAARTSDIDTTPIAVPGPVPPTPTAVVFDPDLAMKHCLNDQGMLADMIQCFFDDVEGLFPQIRVALAKGDLQEAGRLSHRLKGTILYLGAEAAKEAALRVEKFERHGGDQAEAEESVRTLERECELLTTALTTYRSTICPVQDE
jgi:PAS domain S-box-containing protein